jgi:hypothetical protein
MFAHLKGEYLKSQSLGFLKTIGNLKDRASRRSLTDNDVALDNISSLHNGHRNVQETLSEEQHNREQGRTWKRASRLWSLNKKSAEWLYRYILRPTFIYTVVRPTQWTIETARAEANFAREMAHRRSERLMARTRRSDFTDDGFGEQDMMLNLAQIDDVQDAENSEDVPRLIVSKPSFGNLL